MAAKKGKESAGPKLTLRPADVSAEYGISKGTLYRLFEGGLPYIKLTGRKGHRGVRLVKRADLDRYIEDRRVVEVAS